MISTFSHSALESYRSCPKKFAFEHDSSIEAPDRVTADTFMGAAVHRTLKILYDGANNGVVIPLDSLLVQYQKQWGARAQKIEVVNENMAVDDYIALGEKMLITHYEHYTPFDQGVQLGSEESITFELPGTLYKFKARVDRVWKRKDGVVEICDYKTGKTLASAKDPSFWYQMGIYQLAVKEKWPQFEDIELCQYYLRHDEVVRHRMTPEDIDQLIEQLRIEVLDIRRAARLEDFPTREGSQCLYCDFVKFCPAKRHALILAGESVVVDGVEKTTMDSASESARKYAKVDAEIKELEREKEAVKAELVRAARDLAMNRFVADDATISVTIKPEEVFVTKTADSEKFGQLSSLVRDMGLDGCFVLDAGLLMKDIVQTQRLTPEQLAILEKFILRREQVRVMVRRKKVDDDE